jgi:hypothetical protein
MFIYFYFSCYTFYKWSKAVSKVNNKVVKILDILLDCLRRGRLKKYKDSVRGRKGSGCQHRHWLALLKIKKTKKSMMKILTVKALDTMMELLTAMMPPWPPSAMVISANPSHNLCDAPLRVL